MMKVINIKYFLLLYKMMYLNNKNLMLNVTKFNLMRF